MIDTRRLFIGRVNCYPFRARGGDWEFLLLRKTRRSSSAQAGLWQVVSGKADGDEPFWKAALRELEEETGCRPVRFYNLEVESHYDHVHDRVCLNPTFAAELAGDATVRLSPEHDEFIWLPFERALVTLPYPNQRESITRVRFNIVDQPGPTPMEIPEAVWHTH